MSTGRWHPSSCWVCGRSVGEVGHISASGLCPEHGRERYMANHEHLLAHRGTFFDHWRKRTLAAFGVLDAASDEG